MANEELTIEKEKARLTVIGNSYPDTLTDSGFGFEIPELIVDALDELGIELPDWGPIVPPDLIIGIDPDTEIVTLEYPDPEWEEPEWPDPDISDHDWPEPDWPDNDLPDILDYPLPDLDWDDFIDKLEDLGIDPNTLTDLSFTGLDDLGIPTLVSLDMDFNIREDNCPASIVIVTPPNKTEYTEGERIDLTGMVVTAKKADGSTWTNAKYPNGHIPLNELTLNYYKADADKCVETFPNATISNSYALSPFPYEASLGIEVSFSYISKNSQWVSWKKPCARLNYKIGEDYSAQYYGLDDAAKSMDHDGQRPKSCTFTNYRWLYNDPQNPKYPSRSPGYYLVADMIVGIGFGYLPLGFGHDGPAVLTWEFFGGDSVYDPLQDKASVVIVSWHRPKDNKTLTASFNITFLKNESSPGGGGR